MRKRNYGFVLIELVLAIGIILMLFGFISLSLVNEQKNVSIQGTVDKLITDIKSQQLKTMEGIGTVSGQNYGIYLSSDKYVLFKGDSYVPSDTSNFTVDLDPQIVISNITFPSSAIVFSSKSGELKQYTNGNTSFTVQDINGTKSTTVILNRYGVVASEN